MFAFVIWDNQSKRLFAARDRLGQKPFFYVQREEEFLFASEIKALLAVDRSLAEMDLGSLDQYLSLRIIAPPRSMFRSIRKLPPAHFLTFEEETGLKIERYWDLEYEPKLSGSDDDLVDDLEERMIKCLKYHMVSDVPVGAFLSGGLDSTLIVAMVMKHVTSEPIETFSVSLPFGSFDEAPLAKLVANQYGTRHHEKVMIPSLVKSLPRLVWQLDEPSDSLSVCTDLIAKMAREHVKVVLGGDGGDELFGGYDRYYGNRFAGYYAQIPSMIRKNIIGKLLPYISDGNWYKSLGHQLKWLHKLSFLEGGTRYAKSLGYFYFDRVQLNDLYGSVKEINNFPFDPGFAIREAFDRAPDSDILDRMLSADSQIRLPDHSVMILDRMTMAHGLEARSPFMDHEIAEFAARLPIRLKVRGRSLRYIQMQLAKRYLPEPLLNRPKQGFSSALPYMLKNEYPFLFKKFLENSHMAKNGIFHQPSINSFLGEHLIGNKDHGNRLWLLLNSEVWYRIFIEHTSVQDLSEELIQSARNHEKIEAEI
jgi:asparagine synthase (glutamine-hydrolysing)